jgi:hypothetical protein
MSWSSGTQLSKVGPMSILATLENVETELGKIRKEVSKVEDALILYLIDMTILAVKRKAISECKDFQAPARESGRRIVRLA